MLSALAGEEELHREQAGGIPYVSCIFQCSTLALLKFYAEFFVIMFLIYETVFIIFILFEQRAV